MLKHHLCPGINYHTAVAVVALGISSGDDSSGSWHARFNKSEGGQNATKGNCNFANAREEADSVCIPKNSLTISERIGVCFTGCEALRHPASPGGPPGNPRFSWPTIIRTSCSRCPGCCLSISMSSPQPAAANRRSKTHSFDPDIVLLDITMPGAMVFRPRAISGGAGRARGSSSSRCTSPRNS